MTSSLALLLLPALALAERGATRRLAVPDHGALELALPSAWRFAPATGDAGPGFRVDPPKGSAFTLTAVIEPLPRGLGAANASFPEEARHRADRAAEALRDRIAPTAVEQVIGVEQYGAGLDRAARPRNVVFWFRATARRPALPGRAHGVHGVALVDRLLVRFSLLLADARHPARDAVLAALGSARQVDAPPPPPTTPYRLSLAGASWALLVDLPGYEMEDPQPVRDEKGIEVRGSSRATRLAITMRLERTPGATDPAACRELTFERELAIEIQKIDVRRRERGGMAIGEYLIPKFLYDRRIKLVNAYLARDGTCATLRLSKSRFVEADEELFEAVLRSARFEP